MKRDVEVLLLGSYDTGYTVVVHPWRVTVDKRSNDYISWSGNRPLKIKFATSGHFYSTSKKKNAPVRAVTGKVKQGITGGDYHYSIEIEGENNKVVTIDPDYRIVP